MELVRATTLLAHRQGWDVEAILRDAGLAPDLVTTARGRVTEAQAVRIVRTMWDLTDDEVFGLGAHSLPRGSFRLLCYGAIGAADLGGALERAAGFIRALPALPRVSTSQDGDLARVRIDLATTRSTGMDVVLLAALALVHRVAAWAIARPLELVHVEFPDEVPVSAEMVGLLFGAPAIARAPAPALAFKSRWLSAPIVRDDADLERFIADSPADLLARPSRRTRGTTADQVRALVVRGIGGEQPSAEDLAAALAISVPTLRRHLAAEGTSLRAVRDAVLRDAAVAALVHGDRPIADLALHLGFSEASAFTRAFRRWTGSAPSEYRTARSVSEAPARIGGRGLRDR